MHDLNMTQTTATTAQRQHNAGGSAGNSAKHHRAVMHSLKGSLRVCWLLHFKRSGELENYYHE